MQIDITRGRSPRLMVFVDAAQIDLINPQRGFGFNYPCSDCTFDGALSSVTPLELQAIARGSVVGATCWAIACD